MPPESVTEKNPGLLVKPSRSASTFFVFTDSSTYEIDFGRDEEAVAFLLPVSGFARRPVGVFVSPVESALAGAVAVELSPAAAAVAAFAVSFVTPVTGPGTIVRLFCSATEATASVLVGSGFKKASQR